MNRLAGLLLVIVTSSCTSMPPPIPVTGAGSDVSALVGTWSGEYSSGVTQRHGTISLTLAAGADTARGDVLMIPRREAHTPVAAGEPRSTTQTAPRAIAVRFVHAAGDSVFGVLEPYTDPECGCILHTRFEGRLRGDRIEGLYFTRNPDNSETSSGHWNVRRK